MMRLDRAPYLLVVLAWGIAFAGTTLLWPVLDPNPSCSSSWPSR